MHNSQILHTPNGCRSIRHSSSRMLPKMPWNHSRSCTTACFVIGLDPRILPTVAQTCQALRIGSQILNPMSDRKRHPYPKLSLHRISIHCMDFLARLPRTTAAEPSTLYTVVARYPQFDLLSEWLLRTTIAHHAKEPRKQPGGSTREPGFFGCVSKVLSPKGHSNCGSAIHYSANMNLE